MPRERLPLLLIVPIAGLWSVAMGVLGLWLIFEPHTGLLGHRVVAVSAGLGALSAAQLVFIECVSDRLFPRTHPTAAHLLHSSNTLILAGAVSVLLVATLGVGV